MDKTKICVDCGEELPISEFYRGNYSPNKARWHCRHCMKEKLQSRKLLLLQKKDCRQLKEIIRNKII